MPTVSPREEAEAVSTKVETLGRLATLGNDLTRGVLEALQGLESQYSEENQGLTTRLQQLEATVAALRETHRQALQALESQYSEENRVLAGSVEQLEATVVALREAHKQALQALENQYAEENRTLTSRVEQLEATVVNLREAHQHQAASSAGIAPKMTALTERLDHQAEFIRALCEGQTVGDMALNEFADILDRLRSHSVPLPPTAGL